MNKELNILILFQVLIGLAFQADKRFTEKDFEKLRPLTGTWMAQRKNGDIYETWKRSGPKEFSGLSYKIVKSDTLPLEKVRLYLSGTEIIYAPVAYGQNDEKEVLFKLKSIAGNQFVFENLQHDFPSRIVYDFTSKDSLHAYIEGKIQSQQKHIDYFYQRNIK